MIENQSNCMISDKVIHRILENVSDSIIILDPTNNHIIYFNQAVHQSLGYSREEFAKVGNQFFTVHNDLDFIIHTKQLVLDGQNQSFISKHETKDGSIQYADMKLSSIELNQQLYICSIWKDITLAVANEQTANQKNYRLKKFLEVLVLLGNSEEFLSTHVENYSKLATPLISDSLNIDRVSIRLYNQDKSQLNSISLFDRNQKDRLLAKTLKRIEYPVFFDYMESNDIIMIDNIKKSTSLQKMIQVFFSEDGMINALLATKIRVNREVVGYIILQSKKETIWDRELVLFASQISDQIGIMLLNKELKKQQLLLERKVEDRTKALQIAKDIAEKATLGKTKFLSNVSHEVRTPLNAVIGFLSLVDSSTLDSKNKFYIDQIREGSESLLDIINDVLDIAKMEAGKMDAHIELVDLKKFYHKKTGFYSELFKNNGIDFEFKYQCVNNQFYTDINLLNIITNNLLSNALKYTKEGKVKLEFIETILSHDESKVSITVEDTGIGIKEQDFSKIFKSFEQIEQPGYKEYKGTGLGLALTKQIVELLNGTINFNSEFSLGTTFAVTLPMKYRAEQNQPFVVENHEFEFYQYKFPNKRILIVDDHQLNQSMLCSFFENSGLIVDTVCNGYQALKKAESNRYDLIFMDLQMPVMDGFTACQLIRLDEKYNQIPIIALTAVAYQSEEDKIKYNIFDDYIIKPVNKEIIIKTCDYYLMKHTPIITREMNQSSFLELINDYAQISVKDGLYYVSDNTQLYQTILVEFLESHSKDFVSLMRYLDDNDLESSHRILHTLKSLLQTVGMNDVCQNVIAIESSILNHDSMNRYIDDIRMTKDIFERKIYIINYIRDRLNKKTEVPNEV